MVWDLTNLKNSFFLHVKSSILALTSVLSNGDIESGEILNPGRSLIQQSALLVEAPQR